ncbi:MAG: nucleoside monophosphate kinase [Dehalococcoidales bacterium]|nr:nucleoside monophosphate kinase [Dehalococcoidales bacterium]
MLTEKLGLVQVASGDLFRKALQDETELGKQAKVYMEKGQLVPNEITIQMVLERLAAPDVASGAMLDGFPRNLEQAGALDEAMAKQSKGISKVVYIKVAENELLKRLSGRWICRNCQAPYHETDSPPKVKGACDRCGGELYQRADDNVATVKNRLKVYFAETAPLIDYYKDAGKLLEIDGVGAGAEINRRIVSALQ